MVSQEHLRTCPDCRQAMIREGQELLRLHQQQQRPTVRIKGASAYRRDMKLTELMSVIKGVSYLGVLFAGDEKKAKTKAASSIEKSQKLKELGRLIRGS